MGGGGGALDIGGLTDGTSAQADDLFVVERSGSNRKIKVDPMSQAEAETGTATTPRLVTAAVVKAAIDEHAGAGAGAPKVAMYTGPFQAISVTGAYRTVTINTEVSDPDSIAAVSGNQVQIAGAGTYRIRVYLSAMQNDLGNIEARIVNLTPTPDVELAYTCRYMQATYGPVDLTMETPLFELTAAANIEVQVYIQTHSIEIGGTTYDPSSRGAYTATRVILEKVA